MGDTVFSTIRDGFAQIEKMLEEKKAAFSKMAEATDAALDAALTDKENQNSAMLERIAALEKESALKEEECARIADKMTEAYRRADEAAALRIEAELDDAQVAKESLDKKIQRLKEGAKSTKISPALSDAAKDSIVDLMACGDALREELQDLYEQILALARDLDEVNKHCVSCQFGLAPSRAVGDDRKIKLTEIMESAYGEMDVSGHRCASDIAAKMRIILKGPDASGLEDTPYMRALRGEPERSASDVRIETSNSNALPKYAYDYPSRNEDAAGF
jgi:chromosome segregation ATPase